MNETFCCKSCEFITNIKSNYVTHMTTHKHICAIKSLQHVKMEHAFYCAACDFGTSQKSNYVIHLGTRKHKNNNCKGSKPLEDETAIRCECTKSFSHRSGLHYHKKFGSCIFAGNMEKPLENKPAQTVINHITNNDNRVTLTPFELTE